MNEYNFKLLNNLQTIPNAMLLVGKSTSDKEDCIEYISHSLGHTCEDITDVISHSFLDDLYLRTDTSIYVIDMTGLTESKQNSILKFVEEPPARSYIVLMSSDLNQVLATIKNRCVIIKLHVYSRKELEEMTDDKLLLSISQTPDDIEQYGEYDLQALWGLCESIYNNISRATLPNTLSIISKYIWLKEREQGKYSIDIFISMMEYFIFKCRLNELASGDSIDKRLDKIFSAIWRFKEHSLIKTVSKEHLLLLLLIEFWDASRG